MDPDLDCNAGKTCLGRGMHCPSVSSFLCECIMQAVHIVCLLVVYIILIAANNSILMYGLLHLVL